MRGILSERLRIGSTPGAVVDRSPKAMARFSRRHAGVDLVLLGEPSQGMHQLKVCAQNVEGSAGFGRRARRARCAGSDRPAL
jgi:DNA-binding transcriptional LysR family regulator